VEVLPPVLELPESMLQAKEISLNLSGLALVKVVSRVLRSLAVLPQAKEVFPVPSHELPESMPQVEVLPPVLELPMQVSPQAKEAWSIPV
jgi:hypothetical protein